MRSSRVCWSLSFAALLSAGCGSGKGEALSSAGAEPYSGSPLVGVWRGDGGKRTLEILPDGTMVEVEELVAKGTRRLADGTREAYTAPWQERAAGSWRPSGEGTLEYDLLEVGSQETRSGSCSWTLDAPGERLTLDRGGSRETYVRDRAALPSAALQLVGLWRRIGNPTLDYVDMGILFTPGGNAIVVGKNSHWDRSSSTGSIGWLCAGHAWKADGPGTLVEVRDGPTSRLERTRTFEVEDGRLTFLRDGRAGHVYQKVRGPIPLSEGRLQVDAWNALR